jgi:hypothetical protein
MVESAAPRADAAPLEVSAPEAAAVRALAMVYVSPAAHVNAIVASGSLASMTAGTSASPLSAFVFQVGGTSIGLQISANQRMADQFFQMLAHGMNLPADPIFTSTASASLENVLVGQLLPPLPPTADSLDYLNWDEVSSDLDWQGTGDPRNCCGQGDAAVHHADQASLDECFSQMATATGQVTEDE